jgi:hypothetical protein
MDPQARVVAMAALRLASGATDEEWTQVMKKLSMKNVPDRAEEVVDTVRAELARIRGGS